MSRVWPAAVLTALLLVPAAALAVPFPGLIAYYFAENNALDSAGHWDHVGVGGLGYAPGVIGQGFSLDGVDDYATLGPVTISPYRQDDAITYLFWANAPAGGGGYVLGANGSGGDGYGGVFLDATAGTFGLDWTPSDPLADAHHGASFAFTPDTWLHFAVVADFAGNSLALYLNGQPVVVDVLNPAVTDYTPASQFTPGFSEDLIGARFVDGVLTDPFDGMLDEIVMYDRALSSAEVTQVFNEQSPVPEPSTGVLLLVGLAALARGRAARRHGPAIT